MSREHKCTGFVVVHLGAGYHSKEKLGIYKNLVYKACRTGMDLCRSGHLASYIASEVVSILEDSEQTNAGIGSNLTRDRAVECDAGLMDSLTTHFAAVGGIENIRNPIKVAYKLLRGQEKSNQSLVPPMILTGVGAKHYATAAGIEQTSNNDMIADNSFASYKKAMKKVGKELLIDDSDGSDFSFSETPASSDEKNLQSLSANSGEHCPTEGRIGAFRNGVATASSSCITLKRRMSETECVNSVWTKKFSSNEEDKRKKMKLAKHTDCSLCLKKNDTVNSSSNIQISPSENSGFCHPFTSTKNFNECHSSDYEIERTDENSKNSVECRSVVRQKLDTVGAICVDSHGNVCSAVSSGGLLLKHPGRIGPAACYGCGCYVRQKVNNAEHTIAACSASGCGEQLIKTLLAKHCVDLLLSDYDNAVMNPSWLLEEGFLNSDLLINESTKMAGCINIKLTCESNDKLSKHDFIPSQLSDEETSNPCKVENPVYEDHPTKSSYSLDLLIASTTKSFCAGFMGSNNNKPKFVLLELPESHQVGNTVISQGFHFKC